MRYRLSDKARADLTGIWRFTAAQWGPLQADSYLDAIFERFAWLAGNAAFWHPMDDLAPGLCCYPHARHVIYFRLIGQRLDIVRVLHGRMEASRHL
jgi:toxin ParE1/3/4